MRESVDVQFILLVGSRQFDVVFVNSKGKNGDFAFWASKSVADSSAAGVLLAWNFSRMPEWTTWASLLALAAYDLGAVRRATDDRATVDRG